MNLESLKFRFMRLRSMSVLEVVYRLFKALAIQWDKRKTNLHKHDKSVSVINSDINDPYRTGIDLQGTAGTSVEKGEGAVDLFRQLRLFFWQQEPESDFRAKILKNFKGECEAVISEADRLLTQHFRIFDKEIHFGADIKWHQDLLSGRQIPLDFWSDVNYRDPTVVSEVKYVWELNRHQHFVTLAQAYFFTDDTKYADELCSQLNHWIKTNPPKYGINWTSSLEIALRLVSWVWALNIVHNSSTLTEEWYLQVLKSVDAQARFIEKHLSRFSSANNHLIGEGVGLIYAGTYFPQLKLSRRWRKKGFDIVFRELPKQIHADGVGKEQALYYQLYLFDFGLLAIQAAQVADVKVPDLVWQRLESMAEFILQVMDSSGNVPQLGDEDGGQTLRLTPSSLDDGCLNPSPYRSLLCSAAILFKRGDFKQAATKIDLKNIWMFASAGWDQFKDIRAKKIAARITSLSDGGYQVLRSKDDLGERILTFDTGPLGYLSLAAHGHADALSLTLSCYGEQVLIDTGTYLYLGADQWRKYFQGTSAHNTISVDNVNQSEILGPFQWGRKAISKLLDLREDQNFVYCEGSVKGFWSENQTLTHNRRIGFIKPNLWLLRDVVTGEGRHSVSAHFHLGRTLIDIQTLENQVRCVFEKSELIIKSLSNEQMTVDVVSGQKDPPLGWYSESFGHKAPCYCVRISGNFQLPCSMMTLLYSVPRRKYKIGVLNV